MVSSKKDFALSDLESGMVVECENGIRYLVVGQNAYRHGGWNKLSCYNENLTTRPEHCMAGCDIVRVFKPHNADIIDALSDSDKLGAPIWQREPEIKEVTLEEIAEKFGVEVGSLRIRE